MSGRDWINNGSEINMYLYTCTRVTSIPIEIMVEERNEIKYPNDCKVKEFSSLPFYKLHFLHF